MSFNYESTAAGRLATIADDSSGTHKYAQYAYLGSGTIVQVSHPDVTSGLILTYGTGGSYPGFDRFGRVIDQKWTNGAGTSNLDRYQYAYDGNGNRTSRQVTPTNPPSNRDEAYSYDGLDRLTKVNRGTLASGTIADAASTFQQKWDTLEALGNWRSFTEDDDGGGSTDSPVTQTRTHDKANEISGITGGVGGTWKQPAYDAAGNMTQGPRPGAEFSTLLHFRYDVWNRLVEVRPDDGNGNPDSTNIIATYAYDGLNRRIVKQLYSGSTPTDKFDYYYNTQWQVLEVRKNGSSNPLEQWVWDQRYIDAPILRWRDSNTDGTVDDTLYATNDANMNVTGLVDGSTGNVVERYEYDAYGKMVVFDGSWGSRATGTIYGWQVQYAGYRYDGEMGMYQVRNREYDSTIGRWATRDALSASESASLYQYASSNPEIAVDPLGRCPDQCPDERCPGKVLATLVIPSKDGASILDKITEKVNDKYRDLLKDTGVQYLKDEEAITDKIGDIFDSLWSDVDWSNKIVDGNDHQQL